MHEECRLWVRDQVFVHPDVVEPGARVLELGSYDVNGNVRSLFPGTTYVGVDWRQGPNVDVVSLCHEYRTKELYDVVLSLNSLEHDPHARHTLSNATDLLRAGGLLLVSCGGWWDEHEVSCSPKEGHYANLKPDDVLCGLSLFADDRAIPFSSWTLSRAGKDLRFSGVRA